MDLQTDRRTRVKRLALRLGPALAVALVCYLLARHIEFSKLARDLRSAHWGYALLAVGLNITFNNLGRVARFSLFLKQIPRARSRIGLLELSALIFATRTLSSVLPARAGEAFRIVQLKRRHGYAPPSVIAALVTEPVIEVLGLAIPACVVLALLPRGSALARSLLIVIAFASAGILVAVFSRVWLKKGGRLSAIRQFSSASVWLKALFWTFIADLADLLMIGLCLAAVGIHLSVVQWYLILVAVNVAIGIPATPGNIGTLEAGAVVVLGFFGVAKPEALAFALIYHAAHLVPVAAIGAVCLQVLGSQLLKAPERKADPRTQAPPCHPRAESS